MPKAHPVFSCPLSGFQKVITGKHKLRILWSLKKGPLFYGELMRTSSLFSEYKMAKRVFSRELEALEFYGLLTKEPMMEGRVKKMRYQLSDLGENLIPLVAKLCDWSLSHYEIEEGGPKDILEEELTEFREKELA